MRSVKNHVIKASIVEVRQDLLRQTIKLTVRYGQKLLSGSPLAFVKNNRLLAGLNNKAALQLSFLAGLEMQYQLARQTAQPNRDTQ